MSLACDVRQNGYDVKAILLVGGLGTRLRPVISSTPKPMAPVGNRPFLELLITQLKRQGFRRLLMCTGYLGEQIKDAFGNGQKFGVGIEYSNEPYPMGTGGAIRFARAYLDSEDDFLVLNGDSFLEVDFCNLIRFHRQRGSMATLAVTRIENAGRYGTVEADSAGRVTRFVEKAGLSASAIVNGGVYVFRQAILEHIPETFTSLEKEVLPSLLAQGIYAVEQRGVFIDIGTQEDYDRAQGIYDRLNGAAARNL
ncbi:MAG TPA: nucleotidyltransferase family protein [Bryobacteraceae bacterium]|nr:nucleotidyltransferase family protein [Bryobacteraceae bacterium]